MHLFSIILRHPRQTASLAAVLVAGVGAATYRLLRHKPTPDELEASRRTHLAANGSITDGSLIDATPDFLNPHTLVYSYRVGGVTYECNQDISTFANGLSLSTSPTLDLPIQVRYNRANPADSIVVSETWNGLWSLPRTGNQ